MTPVFSGEEGVAGVQHFYSRKKLNFAVWNLYVTQSRCINKTETKQKQTSDTRYGSSVVTCYDKT